MYMYNFTRIAKGCTTSKNVEDHFSRWIINVVGGNCSDSSVWFVTIVQRRLPVTKSFETVLQSPHFALRLFKTKMYNSIEVGLLISDNNKPDMKWYGIRTAKYGTKIKLCC